MGVNPANRLGKAVDDEFVLVTVLVYVELLGVCTDLNYPPSLYGIAFK